MTATKVRVRPGRRRGGRVSVRADYSRTQEPRAVRQRTQLELAPLTEVAAWIGFAFGYAILCLLGAAIGYAVVSFLEGDLELADLQGRLSSGRGTPRAHSPRRVRGRAPACGK